MWIIPNKRFNKVNYNDLFAQVNENIDTMKIFSWATIFNKSEFEFKDSMRYSLNTWFYFHQKHFALFRGDDLSIETLYLFSQDKNKPLYLIKKVSSSLENWKKTWKPTNLIKNKSLNNKDESFKENWFDKEYQQNIFTHSFFQNPTHIYSYLLRHLTLKLKHNDFFLKTWIVWFDLTTFIYSALIKHHKNILGLTNINDINLKNLLISLEKLFDPITWKLLLIESETFWYKYIENQVIEKLYKVDSLKDYNFKKQNKYLFKAYENDINNNLKELIQEIYNNEELNNNNPIWDYINVYFIFNKINRAIELFLEKYGLKKYYYHKYSNKEYINYTIKNKSKYLKAIKKTKGYISTIEDNSYIFSNAPVEYSLLYSEVPHIIGFQLNILYDIYKNKDNDNTSELDLFKSWLVYYCYYDISKDEIIKEHTQFFDHKNYEKAWKYSGHEVLNWINDSLIHSLEYYRNDLEYSLYKDNEEWFKKLILRKWKNNFLTIHWKEKDIKVLPIFWNEENDDLQKNKINFWTLYCSPTQVVQYSHFNNTLVDPFEKCPYAVHTYWGYRSIMNKYIWYIPTFFNQNTFDNISLHCEVHHKKWIMRYRTHSPYLTHVFSDLLIPKTIYSYEQDTNKFIEHFLNGKNKIGYTYISYITFKQNKLF